MKKKGKQIIGIIIQARTGSTRLPEKMILPFWQGKGVFELLLSRIKGEVDKIPLVVATTDKENDDIIAEIAKKNGFSVFRGSEHNVLERFINAANEYGIGKIIRICADNPFLDIGGLKKLINRFVSSSADYIAYCTSGRIPTIKTHFGFWSEGITIDALKKVGGLTDEKLYIEHVTNYIYTHRNQFVQEYIEIDPYIDALGIRMTLDTKEDFDLLKEIYSSFMLEEEQSLNKLITMVKQKPEWLETMARQIKVNSK